MKRILLIIGVVMASLTSAVSVMAVADALEPTAYGGEEKEESSAEAQAGESSGGTCEGGSFLFMRPWYANLNCTNGKINEDQFSTEEIEISNGFGGTIKTSRMGETIKKIVLVIIDDILRIVGILATGFLIYGGLQYAYSGGDTGKAARGKKTITAAIIGMVIALIGQLVVNTFETIVKQAGGTAVTENVMIGTIAGSLNLLDVEPERLLGATVNFVLGAATLVAVGFIIYAAVNMMTAYGSPEKTAMARRSILYAIVGLLVSLLASAIVNFVLGGLQMAMPEGDETEIFSLVNAIFGWIVGLGGLLATAGVVVGGIQYMTSAGDASKTQKAKHTVLYSIIGLGVALIAGAIISFVIRAAF